ncbi:MAG: alcohol dehydrogenase catalytic domain-containing protein [Pseudonocardia sp.]|nr:alcohol dehydrogenase catalytic domain-containing protein [Pseudonocardia sp.]MBO0876007.1 alcohol dehydrogenase catalytic domain-containing protein [Pseudonocardia sp.]
MTATQPRTADTTSGPIGAPTDGHGRPVRFQPRGPIRRAATLLSPAATVAGQVALERDAGVRVERLISAATDRIREHRHPRRPRMRALIASGGGRLGWRDVPAPPDPGPDGALVRPITVATCDLDRALALGATPFPLGLGIGHECVAEVLLVGERVSSVEPGQRVCVPFQINCGRCGACRAGLTSNCTAVPPLSMYGFGVGGGHWGGVLADQVAVPYADAMLVPLPDGVDPVAAASVSDTICDGYRHIAPHLPGLLRRDPGADVLILGCLGRRTIYSPSVTLYAGQVALALGARQVRLADGRPDVRAAATRLGLEPLHPRQLRRTPPAALVVSATVSSRGLWTALSLTAPDGVCSSVGALHRSTRLPAMRLYGRNASFHIGRTHARALMPEVLELMAAGRFHPERVISTHGSLDDAPRLLSRHYRGSDIKTVLST